MILESSNDQMNYLQISANSWKNHMFGIALIHYLHLKKKCPSPPKKIEIAIKILLNGDHLKIKKVHQLLHFFNTRFFIKSYSHKLYFAIWSKILNKKSRFQNNVHKKKKNFYIADGCSAVALILTSLGRGFLNSTEG